MDSICRRLRNPKDTNAGRGVAFCLLLGEVLLCAFIVFRVPCTFQLRSLVRRFVLDTNIDWDAYMEQIKIYREGERDYRRLMGDTGPCVYPAGYVYIYSFLQYITDAEVAPAQWIFAGCYLLTQLLVMELYVKSQKVPPWALTLLCLSKRLHSIYILRLFNDGIVMMIAYAAIHALTLKAPRMAVLLFSLAVSVKMSVLLMAPSVLILLMQASTPAVVAQSVALGVSLQLLMALPFLLHAPGPYIVQAFDLSRVFLYKWTINFKFLPEAIFVSKPLAVMLLLLHGFLLLLFAHTQWCREDGGLWSTLLKFFQRKTSHMERLKTDWILFVIFSGNFVGIVCARSLHYQFYSWYVHTLPFLFWSVSVFPVWMKLMMMGIVEWCWNLCPVTPLSSLILLVVHILLLVGLYKAAYAPQKKD